MDIAVIAQLWKEIRCFIDPVEMTDASEALVSILIENDFEVDEITAAFKRDPEVMDALANHYDEMNAEDEDEDDWEDEETDEDW